MQTQNSAPGLVRRTLNDLIVAEIFLVQAAIESAAIIGDGFNALGKQIAQRDEGGPDSWESLSGLLQRLADDALEPYTSRFKYFRDRINAKH